MRYGLPRYEKFCAKCKCGISKSAINIVYNGDTICLSCYKDIMWKADDDEEEDDYADCSHYYEIPERPLPATESKPESCEQETAPPKQTMSPKQIVEEVSRNMIGQDAAKKTLAVAVYNHCQRVLAGESGARIPKSNILMKGPTGSGKTYLLQNIAKLADLPFCIVDASNLTAAGYKGNNVDTILTGLLQAADGDVEAAEKGIVYLDEFDKLSSEYDLGSNGKAGVGTAVQHQLLKMLEGCVVEVQGPDSRMSISVDTKNILFICGGAFSNMDEVGKAGAKPIGFRFEETKTEPKTEKGKLTADDFIKYGLIPEVVGRLPIVVTLDKLSVEDIKNILTQSEESFLRGYRELMKGLNVELVFQDDALEEVARQAYDKGLGARGINAIIEGIMQEIMFEIPSDPTIEKCIINRAVVLGTEPPFMVRSAGLEQVAS